MDTRKLATFIDLARTCNYSRTAENIFSTQATVSKYIMALEKDWGVTLFTRDYRTVTLTKAGAAILPGVKTLIQAEQRLLQTIDQQINQTDQTLVIKGIPTISRYQAFQLIFQFNQQHPEINLKFSEAETNQLILSLDDGRADIVFTRLFEKPRAEYTVLGEERDYFVALIARDNPLAQQTALTVQDLAHEPFLLLDGATNVLAPVMQTLEQAGVAPQIVYEGRRVDLILEMLNQKMGVSIMMNHSFDLAGYENVVAVPIHPKQYSQLAFIKRQANQSDSVRLFWQFIQEN
ncbi:Transcriptional regulator, LysR family [Latilactobacillus sakei]|uniref:LysR family transcriptional regulator n=1 Tax=Latilactobacillus sakei TaxID=1599 RepID=UPI000C6F1875|nr:LysR family transcriptional regulator [Latilactobacillus sakei]SON66741.1 Transcriptional regulator, LysR family [Latilactobacillus sakei]